LLFFRRFAIGADHIGIVEHFLVKKIGVILGGRWPLATCAVSYRRGHASIFPFPVAEMFHISSRGQQPQLGIERPRPTHDLGAWRSVPGGGSGAVGPLNQPAHRDLRDYALLLARVLLGASLDIGNSDEAIAVPAGYPTLLE
jgi:hypothetical protein